MKNARITFYHDEVMEDSLHLYQPNTQKIVIQNQEQLQLHICYDDCTISSLFLIIENSHVTLIEEYQGQLDSLQMQIFVSKNASLFRFGLYLQLQNQVKLIRRIHNEGTYHNVLLDLSDAHLLHDEEVELVTQESKCHLFSAIYAKDHFQKKYATKFNHQALHTLSDCKIFGVCNDFAQMVIATDAYIKKGAKRTKATQEGRIINLTKTASGTIFPDLHIDENDVEAAHSCSVGSVNLDHLYYLQTRGFSYEQGKSLLIKSYFTPIYQYVQDEKLKQKVEMAIQKRIG